MRLLPLLLLATTLPCCAQWEIQDAHTTASLRGVHAVSGQIAWASGTGGTVLRTTDGGAHWEHCAVPPDAEKLDFRGVQAFDGSTAIVMSSGKGDLSRLYKTTDGCKSWKLLFTNPDRDGFWDAIQFSNKKIVFILGDPVNSPRPPHNPEFAIYVTEDGGNSFSRRANSILEADPSKSGAFAASNSSLIVTPSPDDPHGFLWLGTGGTSGPKIYLGGFTSHVTELNGFSPIAEIRWNPIKVPLASDSSSAGVFSIAVRADSDYAGNDWILTAQLVAVGGNYQRPDSSIGTAIFTHDGGRNWTPAQTMPHGYRSAVVYDTVHKLWITVGPNGTDISTDDGRNWRALKPLPGQPADADQHWNALSLPFVVGPDGRIGRLNAAALPAH